MKLTDALSTQVISGGQTGVDIAGLRAASMLGLRTGGYAPAFFKTQAGRKPALVNFGLIEHKGGYFSRTVANVQASHVTLIIAENLASPGTSLTIEQLTHMGKPFRTLELTKQATSFSLAGADTLEKTTEWLQQQAELAISNDGGFVLNIAGNSTQTSQGIFVPAFCLTLRLFSTFLSNATPDEKSAEERLQAALRFMPWSSPQEAIKLQDVYDFIPELSPREQPNLVV